MKKIKIIKNAQVTNEATFANDELLNEWLTTETTNLSFGHPERLIIDYVENPISEELKALAVEVTQVDVNGEMRDQYIIPSEFSYEIEDITIQVEQERINKEAKEYLVKTDYVVLKFAEALAKGESIEGLKLKYETVLLNRASVRDQIV